MSQSICIVTPGYISTTPRVVKEADALSEAGYDVRVIFAQGNLEDIRHYDNLLLKEKKWRYAAVQWSNTRKGESFLFYKTRIRHYLFKKAPDFLSGVWRFAEYGEGRIYKELARLASLEKADLYIGHYPTGLAAGAEAASRWKTKLAYDVEDLHTEEQTKNSQIRVIESRYIARCAYVSAVTDWIAEVISVRYRITKPLPIYNAFSIKERNHLDGLVKDRKGRELSIHWFSQVIGENRGLEDLFRCLHLLKGSPQVHLRGYASDQTKRRLCSLLMDRRTKEKIYFHTSVPPSELLSRAAEHDVGLASEQPVNLSRELSVTNKFFIYMLAGLAIAATDVTGQRLLIKERPEIGFLYQAGDFCSLASQLNMYAHDPSLLKRTKEASLKYAMEKWNWERESCSLVSKIHEILR